MLAVPSNCPSFALSNVWVASEKIALLSLELCPFLNNNEGEFNFHDVSKNRKELMNMCWLTNITTHLVSKQFMKLGTQ